MNLQEYQAQALTTCLPSALSREYLIPGLVAEVGELFGKKAKAVRDGWAEEALKFELVKEYGDVAWMTAVLLEVEQVRTIVERHNPRVLSFLGRTPDPLTSILARVNVLANEDFHEFIPTEAQGLWLDLAAHSQSITGWSFDRVLQINLDKLQSRQARGTLAGSGDHR